MQGLKTIRRVCAAACFVALFALTGCNPDEEIVLSDEGDTMTLTINNGAEETIVEATSSAPDNWLGYDPAVVSQRLPDQGGGPMTGAAMARGWDSTLDVAGDFQEAMVVFAFATTTGTYSVADGTAGMFYNNFNSGELNADPGTPGSSGTVTINSYGLEGEIISGSFSGTLLAGGGGSGTMSVSGTFSATREPDNADIFGGGPGGGGGTQCPNLGGQLIHIETIPSSSGSDADTIIELHDGAGNFLCSNDDGMTGLFSQLEANLAQGSTYFVRVFEFSSAFGNYAVQTTNAGNFPGGLGPGVSPCPDTFETGFDNDDWTTTSETVPVNGGPISRCLDAGGDEDWFGFTVP